jgi:hypothetical protein
MKMFNVFIRYNIEDVDDSDYSDGDYYSPDIEIEEYAGTFDSRAAAETVVANVDISFYNADKKGWRASAADAWTTFAFVFESDLNSRVPSDAVSVAADKIKDAARSRWRASPAGLANAERLKKRREGYVERKAQETARRAEDLKDRRDRINAKSRATRAAKKASNA